MRSSERILNSLATHSRQPDYKFERLYRLLLNGHMYHVIYQRIYVKEGNMTKGADNRNTDHMSIVRVGKLIASLKDKTYQPAPSRRVYIPKKSGKRYPLEIPTFNGKLLQEVVRMILEAVYEGSFDMNSRGFRPKQSCHAALRQIQQIFDGTRWFIEGNIRGLLDDIDHDMMITILRKRIADERFLQLIRKFSSADYIESQTFHKTYSGTPQGGTISPILANIHPDRLNHYIHECIQRFDKGKERADNPERIKFEYGKRLAASKLKKTKNKEKHKSIVRETEGYDEGRTTTSCGADMGENFRRLKYTRYADDFFCTAMGTKAEAETIEQDIKMFLQERLAFELSEEKTLVTHGRKLAKFLSYEICVRKSTQTKGNKAGKLTRPYSNKIYLKMPLEAVQKELSDYDALQTKVHNGKEQYKPKHRSYLINNDDLEILERYNSEIGGVYNYYLFTNNCYTLHKFRYIMEYNMHKTFAAKYRSAVVKICKKCKKDKVFTVYYKNSRGKTLAHRLYHDGFKRKRQGYVQYCDRLPTHYFNSSTNLAARLEARRCEPCDRENVRLDMHYVCKLKNLRGKEDWEKHMIVRKRKTTALCHSYHERVDGGWVD